MTVIAYIKSVRSNNIFDAPRKTFKRADDLLFLHQTRLLFNNIDINSFSPMKTVSVVKIEKKKKSVQICAPERNPS